MINKNELRRKYKYFPWFTFDRRSQKSLARPCAFKTSSANLRCCVSVFTAVCDASLTVNKIYNNEVRE